MPLFRALLPLSTLALLAGCATYEAKPLVADTTLAQLENRRLDDAALRQFLSTHSSASGDEWDLSRLTLAAFYFSPELDLARAQWREAEANMQTAGARPNPTFNFSPSYNRDAASGITPWILSYALDVPIELAGKRAHRSAEARYQTEAARLHLASAAWAIRSAVRRALTDLHAAESTARIWRDQQPLLAQAARVVEAQVGAGDVSPLLAAQARIALNRAELSARESERAVVTARSRLAEAIGVPFQALTGVRVSYQALSIEPERSAPTEARTWAAQNRADLLAELAAYSAAESALQTEVARQYPDVSFGPGYELDQGEGKWTLGISFTLPVFHQNQGPIAAAKARRDVVAARFLAMQNRVLAEVDRASADYASARGDLDTVKAMRQNLEKQAKTVEAQYQAGETSRLDLVRTQIELADNARAELEASTRAERALSALEDAVQRPLTLPESAWRNAPQPLVR